MSSLEGIVLGLDADQRVIADVILLRLLFKGVITLDQKEAIIRALLDMPPMTEEEKRREEAWLDTLAPTEEEKAEWREHEEDRKAKHGL